MSININFFGIIGGGYWNNKDSKTKSLWFKFFGFGLRISNCPLMSSERNGYIKYVRIGKLKINLLIPFRYNFG